MVAAMIRPTQIRVPDVDPVGRYAGALLQYRGTTLADLYQARTHLEVAAVETLAGKRSPADLLRLDAAIAEGKAALSDPLAYGAKHEPHFHRLLIELAGNQTLLALADMLMRIIELHNQSFLRTHPADGISEDDARAAQRAHARVIDLIRQQAIDKAVTFWGQHLHSITECMMSHSGETVLDVLS
jgi:DNA-binding FadR family transcriptional regulator